MQLPEYMSKMFPGLHLHPPLFYRWPVALRFELGREQEGMHYDEVVLHRATTLYEAVFGPSDWGFIASSRAQFTMSGHRGLTVRLGRHRTFRTSVFALSKKYSLGLHRPAGRKRVVVKQDEDGTEISTLRWTQIRPLQIQYKFLLQALANHHYHLRRPHTDDWVYFVNQTRNLIVHMYDDRGMDILAPSRGDLQDIYNTYKSWLLDYDRVRMARLFEQVAE